MTKHTVTRRLTAVAMFTFLVLLGLAAVPPGQAAKAQTVPELTIALSAQHGPILTDGYGFSLYALATDGPGASSCTGACLLAWAPLQPTAGNLTLAPGVPGALAILTRADGLIQVAYNGMPLYHFSGDRAPGDTNGASVSGRFGTWSLVTPSGAVVPGFAVSGGGAGGASSGSSAPSAQPVRSPAPSGGY